MPGSKFNHVSKRCSRWRLCNPVKDLFFIQSWNLRALRFKNSYVILKSPYLTCAGIVMTRLGPFCVWAETTLGCKPNETLATTNKLQVIVLSVHVIVFFLWMWFVGNNKTKNKAITPEVLSLETRGWAVPRIGARTLEMFPCTNVMMKRHYKANHVLP